MIFRRKAAKNQAPTPAPSAVANGEPRIDLKAAGWMRAPMHFPTDGLASAEDWVDMVEHRFGDSLDGPTAPEARQAIRETAAFVVAMPAPLPGAVDRYWWTLGLGGTPIAAHLYELDGPASSEQDLLQAATLGIGGEVHTWQPITGTIFGTAIRAMIVADVQGTSMFAFRCFGTLGQDVFLLDYIDDNGARTEALGDDLAQMFASAQFRDAAGSESR